MCGIAGIYSQNINNQEYPANIRAMLQVIHHRGPDAQGVWSGNGAYLGHVRLSIIDTSERSNQPMVNERTGDVITFNGEVYNYIELRHELEGFGYSFHTHSDTEVVLKSYEHWGKDCLSKFNGMWAFVIFDHRNQKLFASRDRFGKKPFIYGMNNGGDLVFASETKAILSQFDEFSTQDDAFLKQFIESNFFAAYKKTFHTKLFNLLPGHYFITKAGETPEQKRYWHWSPSDQFHHKNNNEVQEHFNYLLNDSLKLRFRSDVPVGACMSGGLDSTTLVGLASKQFNTRLHTFSCVYPEHPAFDESFYINEAVKKFHTYAHYVTPKHDDFISTIRDSVYDQDGPTGGPSILSQRAVMQLASTKVKVVINGQGSDELLGGYHGYFRFNLLSQFRRFRKNYSPIEFWHYCLSHMRAAKRMGKNPFPFLLVLLKTNKKAQFSCTNLEGSSLADLRPFPEDDLNTILLEHLILNIPSLLHYEDRNSMRFSIESRLPFLDYRLVEFALSLPHHHKIDGGITKKLVYNLAKNVLPESLINRKDKMGFATPANTWFCEKQNLDYFAQFMNKTNPVFDALSPAYQSYIQKHWSRLLGEQSRDAVQSGEISALWRVITASMWRH